MPLKTEQLEEPALNLTSMLDVVMLLIIFFMVSTQVTQPERQYNIELPSVSDTTALTGKPDEVIVNVDVEGKIYVNTEEKTLTELSQLMQEAVVNYPNQDVVVRGDGQGVYQHIMDVVSVIRKAGIRNISLANKLQAEN